MDQKRIESALAEIETLSVELKAASPSGAETLAARIRGCVDAARNALNNNPSTEQEAQTSTGSDDALHAGGTPPAQPIGAVNPAPVADKPDGQPVT